MAWRDSSVGPAALLASSAYLAHPAAAAAAAAAAAVASRVPRPARRPSCRPPHQLFDLGHRLRRGCTEDAVAVCRDQYIVLDADADVPVLLGHAGGRPHIDAGLDRQHHARLQWSRRL